MNIYHNHIAIIGAGISGLALACILKKANIPVVVFEKSEQVSDYGAGISISPNGMRVLKELDIFNEVVSVSANPNQASFFSGNKKINTFISTFPTSKPKFILAVMLDEPKISKDYIYEYRDGSDFKLKGSPRNTAGWNSVEVVGHIVEKIGPILATKYSEFN